MLMQQGHEEGNLGKFAQNSVCNPVDLELNSFGIKHFTHIGISNIKRKREWFWYNLDSRGHFCYPSLSMQPFRCAYIHFSETNIWLDRKIVELGYMFHLISEQKLFLGAGSFFKSMAAKGRGDTQYWFSKCALVHQRMENL